MDYKEDPSGVTRASIEFVTDLLRSGVVRGECVEIEGVASRKADEKVIFHFSSGDTLETNGFLWGYAGEGPHGLAQTAEMFGFSQLTIKVIAAIPREQSWVMHKYPVGKRHGRQMIKLANGKLY
jgi:hypothetical protein